MCIKDINNARFIIEHNYKSLSKVLKRKRIFIRDSYNFCISTMIWNLNDNICNLQLLTGEDNSKAYLTTQIVCGIGRHLKGWVDIGIQVQIPPKT